MKSITVSAPGKLLLMGEIAAVYARPSIVTAVEQRLSVTIEQGDSGVQYDLSGGADARFISAAVSFAQKRWNVPIDTLIFRTKSDFGQHLGFGSSSAVAVATLWALKEFFGKKISQKELFDIAYEAVFSVQKRGSGVDVAASVYGGTLYFIIGGKQIQAIATEGMPIVIGYTGVKADTVTKLGEVAKKYEAQKERVERIFDGIAKLVDEAHAKMAEGDWERVGRLWDFNQEYLRDLGVSTEKLETMISAAKNAGAWGAKLSGAGGGDCMVALAPPEKHGTVVAAIEKVGGQVIHIAPNASGVQQETDDQNEEFIVVDENDAIVGYKTRFECHHDASLIHRSIGVLVFDQKGRVLLHKRSMTKDTRPGFWTSSAGGHVARGETYEQAAKRELMEELGIEAPIQEITRAIIRYPRETEMETLFTAVHDGPFHYEPAEVSEVKFFDKRELALLYASKSIALTETVLFNLKKVGFLS